jgi:hypothetical protein
LYAILISPIGVDIWQRVHAIHEAQPVVLPILDELQVYVANSLFSYGELQSEIRYTLSLRTGRICGTTIFINKCGRQLNDRLNETPQFVRSCGICGG